MSAPLLGAATSTAVLGLSPWILPLIAIAAKLKENEAHEAGIRRLLRPWLGRKSKVAHEDRARGQPVMDERPKAKVEATRWPE